MWKGQRFKHKIFTCELIKEIKHHSCLIIEENKHLCIFLELLRAKLLGKSVQNPARNFVLDQHNETNERSVLQQHRLYFPTLFNVVVSLRVLKCTHQKDNTSERSPLAGAIIDN